MPSLERIPNLELHSLTIETVISSFKTDFSGLSQQEAHKRLKHFGTNEIQQGKKTSPLVIFGRQFKNLMVPILLSAAGLSYYYSHIIDTVVILIVIVLNSIIGFIQEYRAERAISALKKLVVQKAKVKRDGEIFEINASDVVVGDIVIAEEGDKIPADSRIIIQKNALVSESLLTGESVPVDKHSNVLPKKTAMADQKNMVFAGTILVRGSIEAVVVATGKSTILGGIATSLESIETSTEHFQEKNTELVKQMSYLAFLIAVFTFIVGFFVRDFAFSEILPFTLAALVSGIPESLPIITIVVLSLSAHRMAKRNAIVRTLPSTETLSVVNVIITDKTGTLTQNKMTVIKTTQFQVNSDKEKLEEIAYYCNNIRIQKLNNHEEVLGDPTEIAYYNYASQNKKRLRQLNKIEDFPFNQELKLRATLVETLSGFELFITGAPEQLLKLSNITKDEKDVIEKQINTFTSQAMRTIGFAYKAFDQKPKEITPSLFRDITWVGAVGMIDPLRKESAEAVKKAQQAGILVIMATGDHPHTAQAIGRQIGISSKGKIYTATDVDLMSDSELLSVAIKARIFARMTPQAKMRLTKVLQNNGYTVAMTGDGVNDAPSLKTADIGIAMGKGGTDVSREAADIVLADDNFATIISAIEEGRTQFRNIKRTSFFLITTNLAESVSLLTFLLLGFPLPLLPKQILWLNLVGSGVTDIALATEDIHEDVLKTGPKDRKEKILTKSIIPLLVLFVITMTLSAIGVFIYFLPISEEKARTGVFIILSLMQIINMFNLRSIKKSVFSLGIFSNKNINLAFIASMIALLSVVYIPFLAGLFELKPLTFYEFSLLFLISLSVLFIGEISKKLYKIGNGN